MRSEEYVSYQSTEGLNIDNDDAEGFESNNISSRSKKILTISIVVTGVISALLLFSNSRLSADRNSNEISQKTFLKEKTSINVVDITSFFNKYSSRNVLKNFFMNGANHLEKADSSYVAPVPKSFNQASNGDLPVTEHSYAIVSQFSGDCIPGESKDSTEIFMQGIIKILGRC